MIQAIGFDLDETLLHRRTSLLRFIRSQHAKRRLYQSGVPLQEWCDRFLEWDESGYVRKDVVYTRLIAHFQLDSLTMETLWEEYRNDFHHHCVQMPHAAHVLRTIKNKGYPLALITNGETLFQKKNAEALGILPFFDVVLVSEEEGRKKPDPALFLIAAKRMNVPPESCLFVGDHPVNDILGAAAVGMRTAWLQGDSPWPTEQPPPSYIINGLRGLVPLIWA